MKNLILPFLLALLCEQALAQNINNLTVADVRQSWVTRQGSIDSATLSLKPKGLYMECGLYLTFSAQGVSFLTNGDSLEIVLNFTLPEGAIIHDSWLWVGSTIHKAQILDRWVANQIFEGIVKRRQDPSILYKNGTNQYQLRVFPMKLAGRRKVKITWLQPLNLAANKSWLELPSQILRTSKNPVKDFDVLCYKNERFHSPSFPSLPTVKFENANDPQFENLEQTSLSAAQLPANGNLLLDLSTPLQNGYYLSTVEQEGEEYYQLAINPSLLLQESVSRKVAVLFDYEQSSTAPPVAQLLQMAKDGLLNNLLPTDSFNLFFSGLIVQKASNRWIPAHRDSIEHVFSSLVDPLNSYSNLPSLLVSGLQWVQQQGTDGSLMLLSNTSQFANLQASNALIQDFKTLLDPPVPVNVIDFNQDYDAYFIANGTYFYANSYLFTNLAAQTGGSYNKTLNQPSMTKVFETGFSSLSGILETFESYSDTENGFCYGRFNLGQNGVSTQVSLGQPVAQLGKFLGTAPFHISLNGLYKGAPLFLEFDLSQSDILEADTLTREMWYGRYVNALEKETQGNANIGNIIFNSLSERVLSLYTAFLCLETAAYICHDCEDETHSTGLNDLFAADSVLSAYPNPFADHTSIEINLPVENTGQASFEIYNLKGQLVKSFRLESATTQRLNWDARDLSGEEVPSGIYIGLLNVDGRSKVLKLSKVSP